MTAVEVFQFPATGATVRTAVRDGAPWFAARDVCAVLGIANVTDACRSLDDDEYEVVPAALVSSEARPQDFLNMVTEAGLYSLILRSRKPEAKAFKRWITHEVLPAIRRTGGYTAPAAELTEIEVARRYVLALEAKAAIEAELAEAAPKAHSWDTLASGAGDYSVGDAAKILSRDPVIAVGERRLFGVLATQDWIYRQRGDGRWRVYQAAVERGWLSELPGSHYHPRTGELVLDPPQVRVTPKGLAELHRRMGGMQPLRLHEQQALPSP